MSATVHESPGATCVACGQPLPERTDAQLDLASLAAPGDASRKARRSDPATAKAAAARVAWPRAGNQRRRLLEAIAGAPLGLTYEQAAHATGIGPLSASTRISELRDGGWLFESGTTRTTTNGGEATVWLATEAAVQALRDEGREAA